MPPRQPPAPSSGKPRRRPGPVMPGGWVWLVATDASGLLGYAYFTQYRDRSAYRYCAEDSIYVHPERMGRGVGTTLLQALIERCATYGFRTIIAVIGGAEPSSITLHASFGFREAGRLTAVGRKHGRWLDSVYMQLELPSGAG